MYDRHTTPVFWVNSPGLLGQDHRIGQSTRHPHPTRREGGVQAWEMALPSALCPALPAFQAAAMLHVLYHAAVHVALQHVDHRHGDAHRGGRAAGAGQR